MNTVKMACVLTTVLLLAVTAGPAFGVPVTTLNSVDFNIKTFEGDNTDPAGWDRITLGSQTITTDGSSVTWSTPYGNNKIYWEAAAESDWPTNASEDVGFTVEARVRINSQLESGTGGYKPPIVIMAAANTGRHDMYVSSAGFMQRYGLVDENNIDENLMDTNTNTDDFHVFRVAREKDVDGVRGKASFWRDGVLLASDVIGLEYLTEMHVKFGDMSGYGMNGSVSVDYLRMDTTGAYAPAPIMPGDANEDGMVNEADAATLAENWLFGPEATWSMGDFNEDGYVNDADATMLAANWQMGVTGSVSVPEPSALIVLLGIAAALLVARRKS